MALTSYGPTSTTSIIPLKPILALEIYKLRRPPSAMSLEAILASIVGTATACATIVTTIYAAREDILKCLGVLSCLGWICGKKDENVNDAPFSYSVPPDDPDCPSSNKVAPDAPSSSKIAPDNPDAPSSSKVVPYAPSSSSSVWILAKDLDIKHLEDHSKEGKRYWIRTLHLGIIVPKLVLVWGLRIIAHVNATEIKNGIRYTAFLVFDLQNPENLKRASAVTFGEEITEELIEEIVSSTEERNFVILDDEKNIYGQKGRRSRRRPDGWMEIELGEVYNNLGDDSVLNICFWESNYKKPKSGLLVRGIELRPSNDPISSSP